MAKTSRKQIDTDEKNLMAELEKDAKANLDVLAKRLKFSRQKIWRAIKSLSNNQTIWGYTAVVDNEKRSLQGYTLMLKSSGKPMNEKTLDSFISQQTQDELEVTIESIAYVHGEYDWIVSFTAPDITQAKRFYEKLLRTYPDFFSRLSLLETLIAVRTHHIVNPNANRLKDFF
jgi:DNA-binding Lrp family transcriptional regulator